jgi:hypothetical protein
MNYESTDWMIACKKAKVYGIEIDKSWTASDINTTINSLDDCAIEDEFEAAIFMNAFG